MFNRVFILSLVCLFSSCIKLFSDEALKNRPMIKDYSIIKKSSKYCKELIDPLATMCYLECPEGQVVSTVKEKENLLLDLKKQIQELPEEDQDFRIKTFEASRGVCLVKEVRPTGQVYFQPGFCLCRGSTDTGRVEPDMVGGWYVKNVAGSNNNTSSNVTITSYCKSYCNSKSEQNPMIYVKTKVGPSIQLNEKMIDLFGWCTAELADGVTSPSCSAVFYASGEAPISVSLNKDSISGSSFKVLLNDSISYGKQYIMRLEVIPPPTGLKSPVSTSLNFIRKKYAQNDLVMGPLKVMPIAQYSCLVRSGQYSNTTNEFYYQNAARVHFYYSANRRPSNLSPGETTYTCHDFQLYGENDGPGLPRFELMSHHFSLWNAQDPRFQSLEGSESPKINSLIQNDLNELTGSTGNEINLFSKFDYAVKPASANDENPTATLGYIMQPFINSKTNSPLCPTRAEYTSDTPLFKILGDYIGADTEAIYFAEREPVRYLVQEEGKYTLKDTPTDVLLIRESQLKKIWFFYENGLPITADETASFNRSINFFWPPDYNYPLMKKAYQRVYTVKLPQNIGKSASSQTPVASSSRDKRYGCVPKLNDPE
ncbi:hypothetical protein OAK75_07565 [Bacteriovoracales bacterium]|nr:hypothetical protein [Bacteriovoracales bacterium]